MNEDREAAVRCRRHAVLAVCGDSARAHLNHGKNNIGFWLAAQINKEGRGRVAQKREIIMGAAAAAAARRSRHSTCHQILSVFS